MNAGKRYEEEGVLYKIVIFLLLVFWGLSCADNTAVLDAPTKKTGEVRDEGQSLLSSEPNLEITVASVGEASELANRGRYLVRSVAACGVCHGGGVNRPDSPLAGGLLIKDSFGPVRAANITPDKVSGIGSWSLSEVVRAFRTSMGRGERHLSVDSHRAYRWMSDRDAKAIAVYLMQTPPVHRLVERRELGGFERRKWGLISQHSEFKGYVPALPETDHPGYGLYLVNHVAGCLNCHGESKLSSVAKGPKFSAKTLSGVAQESIINHLGLSPEKTKGCPTAFYRDLTVTDARAIASYLATVSLTKE